MRKTGGRLEKPLDLHRKTPKQARSKAIVESIFEATVRILSQVGSQNVTTRKIAELAGVSVGSLYQYFPNKESVMGAIIDVVMKSEMELFQSRLQEINGKSITDTAEAMIDLTVEMFLKERKKIREIFLQAPELGRLPALLKSRQIVVERIAHEMRKHQPGQTEEEYLRTSFVVVNSVMGVMQTMIFDENQTHTSKELSQELKVLVSAYFAAKR